MISFRHLFLNEGGGGGRGAPVRLKLSRSIRLLINCRNSACCASTLWLASTITNLNSVLIATRATVIRLEEERDSLVRQERQLTASIQAALRDGSAAARSVAEEDALQLQQLRTDLTSTQAQLASATKAHEGATRSVDTLKAKLKETIETTQRALKERQKAQVLKVAADAIVELQAYGVASTADKFLEHIVERHDAGRTAELVDHERNVRVFLKKEGEQFLQRHHLGNRMKLAPD